MNRDRYIQDGRITSRHGVTLPPRIKSKIVKYITLQFVITGTIPSKKNMIFATTNLRSIWSRLKNFSNPLELLKYLKDNLKAYMRNSKKYLDFVDNTREELVRQAAKEIAKYSNYGISYPLNKVSIKVYHYWKDDIPRDNSNKYDTIADLFVTCGLLTDDCWQVIGKNESEAQNYSGQILDHITLIDVTLMLFQDDIDRINKAKEEDKKLLTVESINAMIKANKEAVEAEQKERELAEAARKEKAKKKATPSVDQVLPPEDIEPEIEDQDQ